MLLVLIPVRWKKPLEICCLLGSCGLKQRTFKGVGTLNAFCDFLFHKQHKGYFAMAHNSSRYDSYFLLNYLTNNNVSPKLVYASGKIMQFRVPILNITIWESLLFLPMALASLPNTFGIDHLQKKWWFPHFWKSMQRFGYIGPLPDPRFYAPEQMSTSK